MKTAILLQVQQADDLIDDEIAAEVSAAGTLAATQALQYLICCTRRSQALLMPSLQVLLVTMQHCLETSLQPALSKVGFSPVGAWRNAQSWASLFKTSNEASVQSPSEPYVS